MPAPKSDIPYVQGLNGPERAQPVIVVDKGRWTDKSGTIAADNASQILFPAIERDAEGNLKDFSNLSRFVVNINSSGILWINFLGGPAAANTPGSIPLSPMGGYMLIPTDEEVTITGAIGAAFTAGVA